MPPPPSFHPDPFPLPPHSIDYKLITSKFVTLDTFRGSEILVVDPEGLTLLAQTALRDCSFLLRAEHLQQLATILDDSGASSNEKFVALSLLRNAAVAAGGQLPLCQDTGTAIVHAHKGQQVWTQGSDYQALSMGVYRAYTQENLRYSLVAPLTMYDERSTGTNLPAQIDIYSTPGIEYRFLFMAKGGGSANKTQLFQETKAILTPKRLKEFLLQKLKSLGTTACPPYHVVFVIGGTSADACLKAVKLASAKYLDGLPQRGNEWGQALRDVELEAEVMAMAQGLGIGAQFGGRHFALDVRIVRLPRHGASCPVGLGVSCVADRNILARIDREGIWVERLEEKPERFVPERFLGGAIADKGIPIDLNMPIGGILSQLSQHPVGTRLLLTGPLLVARDAAHAKFKERIDAGGGLPGYFKNHPVYYAGPAKTPPGMSSGSFGPTTAGRMDPYVDEFQTHGGGLVMIAKGNRSQGVTEACRKHGGFYLGSMGGPAALLAKENIIAMELIDYPELGMEAIYRIEVKDFPAFILVDDKGNSFYEGL